MSWARMAIAAVVLGTASVAGAITLDGNLSDWGVTIPLTQDATPIAWLPNGSLANVGYLIDDGHVGPGGGGQDFDVEALYSYVDTNTSTLYLAMVTGFDPRGEWGYNGSTYQWFDMGDMFVDIGGGSAGTPTWDYAVRIDPTPASSPNTDIGQAATWSTGAATVFTSWTTLTPVSTPYHVSEPYRVDSGTAGGTASVFWRDAVSDPGTQNHDADHNVLEAAFSLTAADVTSIQEDGLWVHWTMGCGNDTGDLRVIGTGPSTPETPVPEPATIALMGIGLAVAALRKRLA